MNEDIKKIKDLISRAGIIDLDKEGLSHVSHDLINGLCEAGWTYKIKDHSLISQRLVLDKVLSASKICEGNVSCLRISAAEISPAIIDKAVERLCEEGSLVITHKNPLMYKPNFEKLITTEKVKEICRYKIDGLKKTNILNSLGFSEIVDGAHGEASRICQSIIISLLDERFLKEKPSEPTVFFWNPNKL